MNILEAEALAAVNIPNGRSSAGQELGKIAPIDTSHWAKPVSALTLATRIKGARNLNVGGRRAVGPVNGFGQLWQKIFRLYIKGSTVCARAGSGGAEAELPLIPAVVQPFLSVSCRYQTRGDCPDRLDDARRSCINRGTGALCRRAVIHLCLSPGTSRVRIRDLQRPQRE